MNEINTDDPTEADSFDITEVQTHEHHEEWDYEAHVTFIWDLTDEEDDRDDIHVTKQVLFNIHDGDLILNHGHEFADEVKAVLRGLVRSKFGSEVFGNKFN